jgi:opacity protein-like surface antigen
MKRILTTTALAIATASSGLAATNHGFYLGAGIGGLVNHHNATVIYTEPGNPTQTMDYGFSRASVNGDIMLGYMAMINNFMLGAELDYLFGNINKTNTIILDNNTVRTVKAEATGGAWGLGIRLGYSCLERIVPYIRLGAENRRFKMVHASTNLGQPASVEILSGSRKTAFAPGIGMDFKVNKNVVLGLEYRCAFYSAITKEGSNNLPQSVRYKLTPRVSTALLSLKYVWGA